MCLLLPAIFAIIIINIIILIIINFFIHEKLLQLK